MRKFFFGALIASFTAAMPCLAMGGDREIAQAVMTQLQQHKAEGQLKGFDLDLKVEEGVVYLTGSVSSPAQKALVENAARQVSSDVVSELKVKGQPTSTRKGVPASHVVAASSTEAPQTPSRSDMSITDSVINMLQQSKQAGVLRGFELDVSTVGGDVWLRGMVANQDQKDLVLDQVRRVRGVSRVIDDISVAHEGVRQASTGPQGLPTPMPAMQGSSMPVMNVGNGMSPRPFAPSGLTSAQIDGGVGPVAMPGAATYGAGAPRYDQPNLPSYAWPTYAAYPNSAAVTYPKQYSPSAWPYIGPFYPYPQVPLGWRRVALEWDDGLWYLDFTSK
jgi:osmotically-inducible protein OsmY